MSQLFTLTKHKILTGAELRTALVSMLRVLASVPEQSGVRIKVLRNKSSLVTRVSPQAALLIVSAGLFEGRLRGNRVVYIREIDLRDNTWKPCWRNTKGGALVPPIGWDKEWSPGLASKLGRTPKPTKKSAKQPSTP